MPQDNQPSKSKARKPLMRQTATHKPTTRNPKTLNNKTLNSRTLGSRLPVSVLRRSFPHGDMSLACTSKGLLALSWESEQKLMEQCEKKLQGVQFLDANFDANFLDAGKIATESSHATLARSVCDQLEAYFAGDLNKWEIPLDWRLSEGFRRQALQVTYKIPYGNTLSYGEIAKKLKNPKAARAVGSAMATNPISIVVPCHRVVKGTGEIGNYGGGNSVKKKLLQLEGNFRNSDINPRL